MDDLAPQSVCLVRVGDREVGLVRIGGEVRAFENRCLHQGGPVCRGEVLGKLELIMDEDRCVRGQRFSDSEFHLVCPWHGWEYDAVSGECAVDRNLKLTQYPVAVRGGEVFVEL